MLLEVFELKNKLIRTRITAGVLAFIAVAGGILGASSLKKNSEKEESQKNISAEINVPTEEEIAMANANKNAPPKLPDSQKETTEKAPSEEKPSEEKEASTDLSETEEVSEMDTEVALMWPLEGETLLAYSADKTVYDATLDQYRTNESIWIAASEGDVVRASEDGVVESAENLPKSGNTVTVYHNNGWRTTYGQLDSLLVESGEEVFKGEIIGYVGQTTKYGIAQGDHLEFSVYVGDESIDPNTAVTDLN